MRQTHSLIFAYFLWCFGFLGVHRFYYNSKKMGLLYVFTLGLLGLGWLFDLFYLPRLHRKFIETNQLKQGSANYTIAWMLLTFFGVLGLHKLYLRKTMLFISYFMTFGFLGIGILVDLWKLNSQVEIFNINEEK